MAAANTTHQTPTLSLDLLVILGHPSARSFNHALAEAHVRGARSAGVRAALLCLADLDFDPILHEGYREVQALEPDLLDAQRRIEAAAHVTVVAPMWWGTAPALLKGFLDRTFIPGWAFRDGGAALPEQLLRGRSGRVVMTMDAPGWWHRLVYRSVMRHALVTATLKYVGFKPVRTTSLTEVRRRDEAWRAKALARAEAEGAADARALLKRDPARRDAASGRALSETGRDVVAAAE